MNLGDVKAMDFQQEAASTRRVLERIPEEKFGWRPHAKSWSAAQLATHIANLPTWAMGILKQDALDINPPGGAAYTPPPLAQSRAELLETFDRNVGMAAAALKETTDAAFQAPWTFLNGGEVVFRIPRIASFESFVMRHWAHHRGQMTVYLRLLDVPLPQVYGPTADEPGM
ncbi:MAG: DinB family protein [Gemmatimonadota bacterium]